ncbi:MAG: 3-phosphoshikimate 1-carboxyvinyltransferase [Taibaiella sp.]|nr:3-phosphoshikimate 1-carboxyvinyltransferase [Taibaiella sp.]
MLAIINPGYIQGTVTAPASKSMMQRACAAALLHTGKTIIHNPGRSDDDKAALQIIQQLGATVEHTATGAIEITSNGVMPVSNAIDCCESGLSARLFAPIAAMGNSEITIKGKGSLLKRPMEAFGELYTTLGVSLVNFEGFIPYSIKGPLHAADIEIDGAASSQFLTGILFAFAHTAKERVVIKVNSLKSKPYIDLTLDILNRFGKTILHNNYKEFYIDPVLFQHKGTVSITIEGDWSSAACWMVAGAIGGNITISGLDTKSTQADKGILDVLVNAGVIINRENNSITVSKSTISGFEYDATNSPDLFPILSILAAYSKGESLITGVHRLWNKESNRAESITEMLHLFDVPYSIEEDDMCINGRGWCDGATVDACNDHRIVMAAAIAALRADGPVTIVGAKAVSKSYPDFFKDLASLGIDCTFNSVI